jgi:hypothetical protein
MGSKGSSNPAPQVTTVTPQIKQSPLQDQLNDQGQGRLDASSSALLSPWTTAQIAGGSLQAPANATPVFGSGQPGSTAPAQTQLPQSQGQQWWNMPQQGAAPPAGAGGYSPQGVQAMQQNTQPSLMNLGQLLNKQGPNPSPQAPPASPSPAPSTGGGRF